MGPSNTMNPIGIVAGGGSLPIEVARAIAGRGTGLHIITIEGEADDALKVYPHTAVNWASLGRASQALKAAGVHDVIFVGKMARPTWASARPDGAFIASLPSIVKLLRAGGDDAVLRGVLAVFERRGFRVVGPRDVAPNLLVGEGPLGRGSPAAGDERDIAKGFALITALGRHDIGQGAVVTNGLIEAIEGAEGTDRMIARVGAERREQGGLASRWEQGSKTGAGRRGVLVKRPKPGQDMRIDLPAIGPDTVAEAASAGLAGIAVLAGQVMAAHRPELIRRADAAGLFVSGIAAAPHEAHVTHRAGELLAAALPGSKAVRPAESADAVRGIAIMNDLAGFAIGSALVITRGRVVSIGASEPPEQVIARAQPFARRRRTGVAIIGPRHTLDENVLRASAEAGLAGVVSLGKSPAYDGPVVELAEAHGLFIAGAQTARPKTP